MVISERVNFGHVLCPIDLLPDSAEAIKYAAFFAKTCGAELMICHCRGSARRGSSPADRDPEDSLLRLVTRAKLTGSSKRQKVVVVEGDPVVAIPQVAADNRVDLIVMNSRRAKQAGALLGSIAESVCRTAPCPVLVTHAQDHEPGETAAETLLRRVLVAYDFSSDAELALAYGLHLARKNQAELHLLHILPGRTRIGAPEVAMLPLGAAAEFREIENRLRGAASEQSGMTREIKHAVREGQPYREVLAYAEEQEIDLICMGASGTGFGLHALFGSNVDRVLRQSRCPVIVARPLRPTMPLAS